LRGQFISGKEDYFKSEIFGKVLKFVQAHSRLCKLKDAAGKFTLTIENIRSVEDALRLLGEIVPQAVS
jgi:transcription-repair coupling factor (superfamily II helicase)